MLIANPIYDTVFKYLMENIDVAKGIISNIIGEDILSLDFKAQENILRSERSLTVYHLDFIARIQAKQGEIKTVLIELQKSNLPYDIMRFRQYVGEQYKKMDEVVLENRKSAVKEPLPIITIYLLGFFISETLPGVIKVNREYIDVLEGKKIAERNDFIECLTHDSYVIQVPALKQQMRTPLEWVLSIFRQENFIHEGNRRLKSYQYEPHDELMRLILRQLEKAAGDKEVQRTLELEEMAEREYENAFGNMERQLIKKEQELEQTHKELDHTHKQLSHTHKELEQKDKLILEKDAYIKELLGKLGKTS